MNKKSFFLGVVTGIVLTLVGLIFLGGISQTNQDSADNDPIQYLEQPVSYENKQKTSFKVFQVLDDAALAHEKSDRYYDEDLYFGTIVLLLGEDFYCDQIVTVKKPQRVGTYSYTTKKDRPMTVPVIDVEME